MSNEPTPAPGTPWWATWMIHFVTQLAILATAATGLWVALHNQTRLENHGAELQQVREHQEANSKVLQQVQGVLTGEAKAVPPPGDK